MNALQQQLHNAAKERRARMEAAGKFRSDEIEVVPEYIYRRRREQDAARRHAARKQAEARAAAARALRELQIQQDRWRQAVEAQNEISAAAEKVGEEGSPGADIPRISMRSIVHMVANFYGQRVIDILSKRRTKDVILPRQVSMYLARELTTHSFPEIGKHIGRRDHTTVLHAYNKLAKLVGRDPALAADIEAIKRSLMVAE